MANKIPVDGLHHVTVVTRDARATALAHADFYDIPVWRVVDYGPDKLRRTSIHGRGPSPNMKPEAIGNAAPPGVFGFRSARGTSTTTGVTFEIIQPLTGQCTFEHFLATRGPGVHSICLSRVCPAEIANLRAFLAENDIPLAMSYAVNDEVDFLYFDTRAALGGYYLEVIVTDQDDWADSIAADETWDFSAELSRDPGVAPPRRIKGIGHFGVVVPDVEAAITRYARLFDEPIWRLMNWRTEEWLLEDTTTNGVEVAHAFYAARGNVGKTPLGVTIGFEVIQPLWGPSHYKEDFLQVVGPGIHHLDLAFPVRDWREWDDFNRFMAEDFNAPMCMSGWLRGRIHLYHYQDTRKKLGYVVEVHAPDPSNPPKPGKAEHFWYDFSVKADI